MSISNIWAEKLNIAISINEIGPNKIIRLFLSNDGRFMVSSPKDDYYPSDQGPLKTWDYEASIQINSQDCSGDWPKYAAEDLLCLIEEKIKMPRLKLVK